MSNAADEDDVQNLGLFQDKYFILFSDSCFTQGLATGFYGINLVSGTSPCTPCPQNEYVDENNPNPSRACSPCSNGGINAEAGSSTSCLREHIPFLSSTYCHYLNVI